MPEETIEEKTFELSHCKDTEAGLYTLGLQIGNAHVSLSTYHYHHCKGNTVIVNLYSLTADQISQLADLLMDKAWEIRFEERHNKASCGATTEEGKCQ